MIVDDNSVGDDDGDDDDTDDEDVDVFNDDGDVGDEDGDDDDGENDNDDADMTLITSLSPHKKTNTNSVIEFFHTLFFTFFIFNQIYHTQIKQVLHNTNNCS